MTLTFENIFFFPNKQRQYEHFLSQVSKNDLYMNVSVWQNLWKFLGTNVAWLKRNQIKWTIAFKILAYDNEYTTKRGTFDFADNIEDANKTQHDAKRYFL